MLFENLIHPVVNPQINQIVGQKLSDEKLS